MYNTKYKIEKIEEFNRPNPIYLDMEGCICYPAYLNPGERGWMLVLFEDDPTPHRLHTTDIKDVKYDNQIGTIVIETQNTRFTLKAVK